MRPSFAHFGFTRHAFACWLAMAFALSGCASLPPPTAEFDAAQQALARAQDADADQYAPAEIAQARSGLERAQEAMTRGRDNEARAAALAATADADLARVLSAAAAAGADRRQRQAELAELRRRLQLPEDRAQPNPLSWPVSADTPALRLQQLDADPRLAAFAQYERLQARQALTAMVAATRRALPAASQLAERRVAIAEQAARIEAARRQIDALDRERSDLLLEASRRDAERARAESERLRLQAQVQAEEAARLREEAEQAQAVLQGAQIDRDADVAAAREQEIALAREEAELVAGAKLPPSRQDARGQVFTLGGDAFASGQAQLTRGAAASVRALGTYLARLGFTGVEVVGHTDSQGNPEANQRLSQQRADAVRAGLVEAGLGRGKSSARGEGDLEPVADNGTAAGRARNRRVDIIVPNN
jgi:outer membrane protein OmpA-like peptidoglycan-associated protein